MTNKNIAIRVRELDKKFTFGRPQEKYHTLRDAIVNLEKAPFKRFHCAPPSEEFWVLKDVSFDVEQRRGCGDYWKEWGGEIDGAQKDFSSQMTLKRL